MTSAFPFCYGESSAVCNDKAFIITETALAPSNPCGNLLKYLFVILNSNLAKFWIRQNCPALGEDRRELSKVHFENFPIPDPSNSQLSTLNSQLSSLAAKMLTLTAEAQKKYAKFLSRVRDNLAVAKISTALVGFYTLSRLLLA